MTNKANPKRAEKRIREAKLRARSELIFNNNIDEWTCLDLANKLNLNPDKIAQRDRLERIDTNKVSHEEFIERYEKPLRPVVLRNVTESWPAREKWNLEYLSKRYRNRKFKCGEDDLGYNVELKLKHFIYYMRNNVDDSPLYIFDGNFGEDRKRGRLLHDYSLPKYFQEDLFKYAGEYRRPPYRWLVIGSARSGTGIHIDPLGTSAWNALLVGYKLWCLFSTSVPKEFLKVDPYSGGKQRSEAAQWFNIVYPHTQGPSWPEQFKPIEILQRPGETVFVPSGWWHVVINLTDTIAITQNFVSTTNFPIAWHKTVRSRPKLSKRWLEQLKTYRPDLVELTKSIDINSSIGVNSDSSSGSSSSSSSGSCSCSSCSGSESDDSGQASLSKKKKRRQDSSDDSLSSTSAS